MKQIIVVAICLLIISKNVFAIDPGVDWKTIESEHVYVHYADGDKKIAERAIAISEEAYKRLSKELNWKPVEKTHVVLSDETDVPNGYVTPIFFNRAVLFLAPPTSVNTLEDFDDWFATLIYHEFTHIIHLDKSAGSPEFLRNIFGRFFLLFPNLFQPSWLIEGLATYKETDLKRGIGRGQSAMFASMMREEVDNGLQPISHVNLPVSTWPAGTTRYLYGVYFMTFIVERYGEDKLQQWIEEYSNNLFPFFINTTVNQVLGKNLTPLWAEYEQWLKARFLPQIKAIKAKGIKAGIKISTDEYRTDSVRAVRTSRGEEVYYVRNGGYKRASLMHIKADGKTEELMSLNNGINLDLHPTAGLLLTQNEFCNNYTIYKDIYAYDKVDNRLRRLTKCGRYLFASWHPDGKQILAVHHDAFQFELQLLDKEARLKKILWKAKDGEILGQIDVSPDGKKVVAAKWRKGDGWNIELFDIGTGKWEKLTSGVRIEANPQFTPSGKILFSMEVDGVYNLQRYYPGSGRVVQITNLIGGAFQSSQASENGPVYYAGYSADGYAIYKMNDASPVAQPPEFDDSKLKTIKYKVKKYPQQDYSALANMYPRWWFPSFKFSEQRSEYSVATTGSDALGIHNYSITASYDSKLNQPAGQVSYGYADRVFLSAVRLNDIFLDVTGGVTRVSKRNVLSATAAFPDRYIQKQANLLFGLIYDSTSDAELVAGAPSADDFDEHLLGVAWLFESTDNNPLSISANDGMRLRLVAEDSDLLNSDFTGQVYTLDWRQFIRTGRESVLALRFVQGWGTQRPRDFKLGGEGFSEDVASILLGFNLNEPVFDQRRYALRGYKEGMPQLQGRRAQLLSGEWRFPLQRLERGVMTPPVGIMQWFGTVFVETGAAYESSPGNYYSSAGVEFTADINLFYNLLLRTRAGYAHGFDNDIGDDRVYIKIGSSF